MSTRHLLVRSAAALIIGLLATAAPSAQTSADRSLDPPARERPAPEVGQPYGKLHLPTVDGRHTRTLVGLRGQPVLLVEFASW